MIFCLKRNKVKNHGVHAIIITISSSKACKVFAFPKRDVGFMSSFLFNFCACHYIITLVVYHCLSDYCIKVT